MGEIAEAEVLQLVIDVLTQALLIEVDQPQQERADIVLVRRRVTCRQRRRFRLGLGGEQEVAALQRPRQREAPAVLCLDRQMRPIIADAFGDLARAASRRPT